MSPRARANAFRIALALAIVAGVVWWRTRKPSDARSAAAPIVVRTGADSAPGAGSAAKPAASASDRVVLVRIAAAERKTLPVWIEGLGTVAAMQQVTVRAQVDGRLDKVLFTEGQPVKAGQVLAQIDPRPFRVQLLQAQGALARDKAQLDAARKSYDRLAKLHEQQLLAQAEVDQAAGVVGQYDGAVKIDQAAVEAALLNLDWAQVKAPLDGVTGVRLVDAGNLVRASDTNGLVVITQLNPAAVMFTLPADKLPIVAAAMQRGEVTVEVLDRDGTKQIARGTLAVIDNQVNQATSTLRLKAVVPNPMRTLWPQAFVKARILVEERDGALVIPAAAVQRGPQGVFVYVVGADKTAALKQVTVDLITGDVAVISKGVEAGDQVVIEGASQLRPGGRVEVAASQPRPDKRP